jgi:hypothetical protein
MTKRIQNEYLAPGIEMLEILVEQVIAVSGGQLPEYEEDDDIIILGSN